MSECTARCRGRCWDNALATTVVCGETVLATGAGLVLVLVLALRLLLEPWTSSKTSLHSTRAKGKKYAKPILVSNHFLEWTTITNVCKKDQQQSYEQTLRTIVEPLRWVSKRCGCSQHWTSTRVFLTYHRNVLTLVWVVIRFKCFCESFCNVFPAYRESKEIKNSLKTAR